mmetsp:Transcript_36556/g.61592  ORF Transcript_36556/g.61592 Transcript_36556/m.61592 type:complete len:287 (+) Transcript_36556:1019-1879(+)
MCCSALYWAGGGAEVKPGAGLPGSASDTFVPSGAFAASGAVVRQAVKLSRLSCWRTNSAFSSRVASSSNGRRSWSTWAPTLTASAFLNCTNGIANFFSIFSPPSQLAAASGSCARASSTWRSTSLANSRVLLSKQEDSTDRHRRCHPVKVSFTYIVAPVTLATGSAVSPFLGFLGCSTLATILRRSEMRSCRYLPAICRFACSGVTTATGMRARTSGPVLLSRLAQMCSHVWGVMGPMSRHCTSANRCTSPRCMPLSPPHTSRYVSRAVWRSYQPYLSASRKLRAS